jgi:hypothetical protein
VAVKGAGAVLAKALIVESGAVALMLLKKVLRMLGGELHHQPITENFCGDRGKGDERYGGVNIVEELLMTRREVCARSR